MKWIFYAMLLVNAAFLTWQLKYREPYVAPAPPTLEMRIPGPVNRLLLLSEYDAKQLRERRVASAEVGAADEAGEGAEAGSEDEPDTASAAEPSSDLCLRVGPLSSPEAVGRIGVWLEAHGGSPVLREGERREVSLFWVYFPPFPNRDAAVNRVLEMREKAIEDIYVIPRGDMANAVSLGLYSHRGSLDRRLQELRAKGYEPSIVPRYRTTRASWYEARFSTPDDFLAERFAEIFPETETAKTSCRGV